jgi:hypothetical protein
VGEFDPEAFAYDNGQPRPGSYQYETVKRLLRELDAEVAAMRHTPEPRGFRVIEDASGYPLPIYDAPPIRRA